MSAYQPRGALAKALYNKVHNDNYLENYDMSLWYKLAKPLPDKYQCKFIQFEQPDRLTLDWLDKAKSLSANLWIQLWHIVARLFLGIFMTQTDINGWLRRGSMFILSTHQFEHLLQAGGFSLTKFECPQMIDILDIGAGDGEVTTQLAKAVIHMGQDVFLKVYTTETSWTMRERLERKKFIVANSISELRNLHLVSCLNVLDRCADPHKILADIHHSLARNGRAVIALVLPYSHYVESTTSHLPIEPLMPYWPHNTTRLTFDAEAVLFFQKLEQIGFRIEAWTKAPYLCEGDLRQSFYWLNDVVVVLSKV